MTSPLCLMWWYKFILIYLDFQLIQKLLRAESVWDLPSIKLSLTKCAHDFNTSQAYGASSIVLSFILEKRL